MEKDFSEKKKSEDNRHVSKITNKRNSNGSSSCSRTQMIFGKAKIATDNILTEKTHVDVSDSL